MSDSSTNNKASVLFNRQSLALLEQEAKKRAKPDPCACLTGFFKNIIESLGPDRRSRVPKAGERKVGDLYYQPQELAPVEKSARSWFDLSKQEQGSVIVACKSSVKEDVPGWTNQDSFIACVPDGAEAHAAGEEDGPWDSYEAYATNTEGEEAAEESGPTSVRHILVGVLDGHGRLGHQVSGLAAERIPGHWLADPGWKRDPAKALKMAVCKADEDVYKQMATNVEYNGSTAVIIYFDTTSKLLHCANVGDSRAVLGRHVDGRWEAVALTTDITPDQPDEKERIEMCGGIIAPARVDGESMGPNRVWEDWSLTKPGLAMARSLGDGCARRIGVAGDPEMTSHKIRSEDKFVLLASDGLWDAISNEDAVKMAARHLDSPQTALAALTSATREKQEGSLEDDTTIVMLIFNA